MLFMTLYAFLIISAHKILNFMRFLQKHDIRTDGPTEGHTLLQRCEDASKNHTHARTGTNAHAIERAHARALTSSGASVQFPLPITRKRAQYRKEERAS